MARKRSSSESGSRIDRRQFLKATGAAGITAGLAGCGALSGGGSDFPNQDMTIIVPSPPGGGFSNISEVLIPYMEEHLPGDHSISLDHAVGGGGLAATEKAWGTEADGHTMLFMYTNQMVIGDLFLDSEFDPREFRHIGLLTRDPYSLLVRQDTNVQSWEDFVNRISEFTFATQGVGTNGHLDIMIIGELVDAFGEEDMNFVHYEGSGPAAQALANGEADMLGQTVPASYTMEEGYDNLELLFTFTTEEDGQKFADRTEFFTDDIPTDGVEEAIEPTTFPRFFTTPPGVEDDRLETLRSAFEDTINDEDFLSDIEDVHMLTAPESGPDAISGLIDSQYEVYQSEPFNSILQEALE